VPLISMRGRGHDRNPRTIFARRSADTRRFTMTLQATVHGSWSRPLAYQRHLPLSGTPAHRDHLGEACDPGLRRARPALSRGTCGAMVLSVPHRVEQLHSGPKAWGLDTESGYAWAGCSPPLRHDLCQPEHRRERINQYSWGLSDTLRHTTRDACSRLSVSSKRICSGVEQ